MSNSFLSPTAITNEALASLHSNLVFCKKINKQYDSSFASSGATMSGKIGPSLRIRKPNRYTVRTTAALALQDHTEDYTTLSVTSQYGVDIHFTSADLTLTIDEFSNRYLKPAMARLASEIDYQAMSTLVPQVYNYVNAHATTGAIVAPPKSTTTYLNAGAKLDDNCAPRDGDRYMLVNPAAMAATVGNLTGLFNSQATLAGQYDKGLMGEALGFKWGMSQTVPTLTNGTRTNTSPVTTVTSWANGQTTMAVTGGTSSGTYTAGDPFTVADIYSVNPETKQSTGNLMQFVVNTAQTSSSPTLAISPTIYVSGPLQNVTTSTGSKALLFGGTASTAYAQNLAFHKDAFTIATADLVLPKGVDFAAREVFDGISMRIVRAYDINNDRFPCRIDILWGTQVLYPQWACRVLGETA
jgi:hypothetical protein